MLVILVLIQFYPYEKPMVNIDNPNDLLKNNKAPKSVANLLKSSCYDCHSYETTFPWYSNIAPVKWLVYNDINKGREELNFSEWNIINKDDKAEILDDISTVLLDEEMPLKKYILLHPEAKLSLEDRENIANWAELLLEDLYE